MNYYKIYNQICQRAKSELEQRKLHKKNGGYYEGHHIIPKCLGGKGKSSNWNDENIIPLTAGEHFLCHLLLCEIYPRNKKIKYISWAMSNKRRKKSIVEYKVSSRVYERLKIEFCKSNSKIHKNKKISDDIKNKIRESLKGNIPWNFGIKTKSLSEEHKIKISINNKGKHYMDKKSRKTLSDNRKGEKNPMYGKTTSKDVKLKLSNALKNHPKKSKKIIEIESGLVFCSLAEYSRQNKCSVSKVWKDLQKGVKLKYY